MATGPNTASTYYLDSAARQKCAKELSLIDKKCKPEPPPRENERRRKRSGLGGKISALTEKLDDKGKSWAGYNRDRSTGARDGNAWMDDHCSGLWVSPPNSNKLPDNISEIKEQLDELAEKLDMGMLDKLGMLKDSLGDIADVAKEMIPPEVVEDMLFKLGLKTAAKGGVGAVLGGSIIVPVAMGAWTAYDLYNTANELATLAGPKGLAAMDAFNAIYDIGEEARKLVDDLQTSPGKGMTNAMTLMAKLDPCIRARKCLLVRYKNTTGSPTKARAQARHGKGCCPGQTGHHIMPGSMMRGNCPGYDHDEAPVMCLEGSTNRDGWGSHGNAHSALKRRMDAYRNDRTAAGQSPNTISYQEGRDESIDAVREVAAKQCDPDCLKAQLDSFYDCKDKDLVPQDGTGEFVSQPEPDTNALPDLTEE